MEECPEWISLSGALGRRIPVDSMVVTESSGPGASGTA